MMENIDTFKQRVSGQPAYRLRNAKVFTTPGGFHYIDYLDPVEAISPDIDENSLTDEEVQYIEKSLQSNPARFQHQVDCVRSYLPELTRRKLLDIGCGGGLFLAKIQELGAEATGIELCDSRARYAQVRHGLTIVKRPIEDGYWHARRGTFDAVTLWDVIEHVNYPISTLQAAADLLQPGGYLFIDTPCRDAFYHRCGEFTYKLSNGRFPTFLNAMYSQHQFGHKQIFSTAEMQQLFEMVGLEVVESKKFHELSFPYLYYLKKLLRSELLAKLSLPVVSSLLFALPIRNKMLVVGRKKSADNAGGQHRHAAHPAGR